MAHHGRNAFQNRLPERTIPSSSQPQFGQSAPGIGRPAPFTRPPQQPNYGTYSQFTAGPGHGGGRAQVQPPPVTVGGGVERESNTMTELSDEQRDEINEAFQIFDMNGDGALDIHELRTAFRALGFRLEKPEVAQIMAANGTPKPNAQLTSVDGRGNGSFHPSQLIMSRDTFARLAAQRMVDRDPRDEIDRAFSLFDVDGKGFIGLDDLRRVARELGEVNLEEQEFQTMIDEFDYEGRGGISKQAFFEICLQ